MRVLDIYLRGFAATMYVYLNKVHVAFTHEVLMVCTPYHLRKVYICTYTYDTRHVVVGVGPLGSRCDPLCGKGCKDDRDVASMAL